MNDRNYKLYFKSESVLYDVSDYVDSIKSVPYVKRNPDFTLICEGYKVSIPSIYDKINSINEGTQFLFYSSSTLIHNGFVEEKEYDYKKRIYNIKIEHAINNKLKKVRNDKDYVHNYISMFTQSVKAGFQSYNFINHNNLITAYFSASGFNLDWNTYYTSRRFYVKGTTGYDANAAWNYFFNVYSQEILYLPEAIYCVNQPKVFSPKWLKYNNGNENDTSPNTAGIEAMLTTFDMVDVLSSFFGYNYIPKDSGSFYVVSLNHGLNTTVNFNSNEIFDLKEKKIKSGSGVSVNFSSLTLWVDDNVSPFFPDTTRWFPSNQPQWYYIFEQPTYNGRDTDGNNRPVVYNNSYATGSFAKNIKWYNHLVPIYTSSVYNKTFLIYPSVVDEFSIVGLQFQVNLKPAIEYKLETFSKNLWENFNYIDVFQEVEFSDLKKDEVSITYRKLIY